MRMSNNRFLKYFSFHARNEKTVNRSVMLAKLKISFLWVLSAALCGMLVSVLTWLVQGIRTDDFSLVIQHFETNPDLDAYNAERSEDFIFWKDFIGTSDFIERVRPEDSDLDPYRYSMNFTFWIQKDWMDEYSDYPNPQLRMFFPRAVDKSENDWLLRHFMPGLEEFKRLSLERGFEVNLIGDPVVKHKSGFWPSDSYERKSLFWNSGFPSSIFALITLPVVFRAYNSRKKSEKDEL